MTISYPLDLPETPGPVRVVFSAIHAVGMNRSPYTYQTQVQQHSGQIWAIEVTLPNMNRATAEEWVAFLLKLNGQRGTFMIGDPASYEPRGSVMGYPLTSGAQAAQASSISTKGWIASESGVLLAGDYIQLGNRLHKVLDDVDADGSGNVTFDIWPSLRESLAGDDIITTRGARGEFRLTDNIIPLFDVDTARIYGVSFAGVEAI